MNRETDLEEQLDSIVDDFGISVDDRTLSLFNKALEIQYELGRASVHNELGLDYFDN